MNDPKICAVLISFHPSEQLISNIAILRPQVQGLVIVDNGSTQDELARVRASSTQLDFNVVENGRNLGIGAALNIGVRWASENGFEWVALFDQDSTCTESLISDLWSTSQSPPTRESVAITVPLYADRVTRSLARRGTPAQDGSVMVAMTSGSLMPARIFEQCGYFNEELFIDQVDFEYCLRVRKSGFLILQSDHAVLLHSPGSQTSKSIFGMRLFTVSNHNPKRRYYITRNSIWLIRKFWRCAPSWCLITVLRLTQDTAKIVLAEKDRRAKLKNTLLGVLHGLTGKLGNTLGL
jgi:rhamnosyltransferase